MVHVYGQLVQIQVVLAVLVPVCYPGGSGEPVGRHGGLPAFRFPRSERRYLVSDIAAAAEWQDEKR